MDDADRLLKPDGEQAARPEASPADAIRKLQQQAGNAAVAGMLRGSTGSAGAGVKQRDAAGGGFEADLFDRSILDPLRSLYAVVRDHPTDADLALEKLQPIGEAIWEYEQRYRGKDEGLANAFYAIRGWLGPAVQQLRGRVGKVPPWTDDEIASRIQAGIEDMLAVRDRLR